MTIISTINFRNSVAANFINEMGNDINSLYIFLSQQTPWETEPLPPVPTESVNSYKIIWDNMFGMKLITLNNMQLVIPRNNWITNNVYTAYTDTSSELFTSSDRIYILNSNNEVFKCLANNNGVGSVVMPFGLGSSSNNYVQTLSDGYSWKYMFQIAPGDQFFNTQWIPTYQIPPVNSTQDTIKQAAVAGSIDTINVIDGGDNYLNAPQAFILDIVGDGTGANCYANVVGGSIQNVIMVSGGENYTYANCVVTDLSGGGAQLTPVMPPPGGNGFDAASELGATSVMISITTLGNGQGFLSTNVAFRQTGLVLNPLKYQSNTISSNTFVAPYLTLGVTGGVGIYANTEVVYQGTSLNSFSFLGTIIDFDPSSGSMRLNNIKGIPQQGVILYGSQTNAQRYVININNPDVQPYTGKFLYIDNEAPLERTPIQTEFFQYVVQF